MLARLGLVMHGWARYFRHAVAKKTFSMLDYYTWRRVARMLMCFEDGRRLHPDTVTSRFNRLVDQAGVRRIRLLSRPGARFRCCHRPVSPDRSPNPPCELSPQRALHGCCRQAGSAVQGSGIWLPR